ncbi:hypothetical protein [Streptomyces sp. NPDC002209]|uniref:hypothetical protein n=1 Tax=Streptomyces sp. NPDC002209 TaxID=3364638 RepID=UPI0036B4CB0F
MLQAILAEAEQTESARADEISELRNELKATGDREYELLGEKDELDTELPDTTPGPRPPSPLGEKGATFPVPTAVDASGELYTEAHLRIGGGNTVAPRLHFYDDGPGTGHVYVGCIGPHLTNTRT